MRAQSKPVGPALVAYCILFFAAWTGREFLLRPILDTHLTFWTAIAVGSITKIALWTLPALCLVKYFEGDVWLPLARMFPVKISWRPYLAMAAAILAYHVGIAFVARGHLSIHPDFQASALVGTVLLVGITEEAVFRGWMLNTLLALMYRWPAVIVSGVLFVLVHLPVWIYQGALDTPVLLLTNVLGIFLLSVLFSWTFIRSRSIWVPILLHMSWNLCNILFLGV